MLLIQLINVFRKSVLTVVAPMLVQFAEVTERMGTRSAAIRAGAVVSVCSFPD